jgi:hypothetical protein
MKKAIFLLFFALFCENISAQAPINDNCAAAIEIKVNLTTKKQDSVLMNHLNATPESFLGRCFPYAELWYKFTAPTEVVRLESSYFFNNQGPILVVYEGTCSNLKKVNNCQYYYSREQFISGLTVGKTYHVAVFRDDLIEVPTQMALYAIYKESQTCKTAKPLIINSYGSKKDSIRNSTLYASEDVSACGHGFSTLWYEFKATHKSHIVNFKVLETHNNPSFKEAMLLRDSCNIGGQCEFIEDGKIIQNLIIGKTYKIIIGVGSQFSTFPFYDFSLSVSAPPPIPANDDCSKAQVLSYATSPTQFTKGTTIGATQDSVGTKQTLNVWYKVNLEDNLNATAIHIKDLVQVKKSPLIAYESRIYSGSCQKLVSIGSSFGSGCTNYWNDLPKGNPVYIEFFGDDQTNFNIGITKKHALISNQTCDKALNISIK